MILSKTTLRPTGSVLVFGGPYSNLQATTAILEQAKRLGLSPDRVVCTGDLTAYCGAPAETISMVRESGIHVVSGNCDEQLALGAEDCGCGFEEGSACDRLSAAWFAHASARVGAEQRRWLGTLPGRLDIEIGGLRFAVIHGTAEHVNAFVFESTPWREKRSDIARLGVDGVIAGHSGIPFTQVVDGLVWHNAGVVGMPANDGTPRVWYSLVQPTREGVRFSHHTLDYDVAGAQHDMREAGLPADYHDALATGVWPSLDVLPEAERAATGIPLKLTCHLIGQDHSEPALLASA